MSPNYAFSAMPSVLWRWWLGGRKGIRHVKKTEWWGAGVIICLERGAELHMAQRMPLPLTISCLSKIQIGFTFLVPAHLGCPGKGPLNRCCCCCVAISPNLFEDKAWLSFMTLFISNFSCLFNGQDDKFFVVSWLGAKCTLQTYSSTSLWTSTACFL